MVDFYFQIVGRYDVILVQEIRDSVGETVVPTLLAAVNRYIPRARRHAQQNPIARERSAYFGYRLCALTNDMQWFAGTCLPV